MALNINLEQIFSYDIYFCFTSEEQKKTPSSVGKIKPEVWAFYKLCDENGD